MSKMGYKDFLVEYYTFLTKSTDHDQGKDTKHHPKTKKDDDKEKDDVEDGYLSKYHPSRIRQWMEVVIAGSD